MMVSEGGLEPPRPNGHWHLKPARLPIPPLRRGHPGDPDAETKRSAMACLRHPPIAPEISPWDEALEDQAVGDRGETEHQRSKHGDAIEIALNHRRAGGCRTCAATKHVREPAAFAAVQKHKKDQGERREDVQWGDEPDHG